MKVTSTMISRGVAAIPDRYWAHPTGSCDVRDRVAVLLSAALRDEPEPTKPPAFRPGDWVKADCDKEAILVLALEGDSLTVNHALPKNKAVPWTIGVHRVRHATGEEVRKARGEE